MEVIEIPVSEAYPPSHPILGHKDFVKYGDSNNELKEQAKNVNGVWGFLHGKAVKVKYKFEK